MVVMALGLLGGVVWLVILMRRALRDGATRMPFAVTVLSIRIPRGTVFRDRGPIYFWLAFTVRAVFALVLLRAAIVYVALAIEGA